MACAISSIVPWLIAPSFSTTLLAQDAPITYVAAQMGHTKPTTILQWRAHWLPRGDKAFVDRLDGPAERRHRFGTVRQEATRAVRWGLVQFTGMTARPREMSRFFSARGMVLGATKVVHIVAPANGRVGVLKRNS